MSERRKILSFDQQTESVKMILKCDISIIALPVNPEIFVSQIFLSFIIILFVLCSSAVV